MNVAALLFVVAASGDPLVASGPLGDVQREMCRIRIGAFERSPSGPARDQAAASLRQCLEEARVGFETQQESEKRRADGEKAMQEARRASAEREARMIAENKASSEAFEADQARLQAMKSDPSVMGAVISSVLCWNSVVKREALSEVAKERKYARIAGMVNKAKLYDLQQKVREVDESNAAARADLRGMKTRPLACTSRQVQDLLGCMDDQNVRGSVCEQTTLYARPDFWSE